MVARETFIREGLVQLGLAPSDEQVARLALLADILQNQAMRLGFLGPNEGPRIHTRHILESAAVMQHLPGEGPIVDVGSGAGLPGLVLAALDRPVTMIETLGRRASYLREAAGALGVTVLVMQERAEDVGRGPARETFAHAVARALASPPVAMELCLPLVAPGGSLTLMVSPDPSQQRNEGKPRRPSTADQHADTPTDRQRGRPSGHGELKRVERPSVGDPAPTNTLGRRDMVEPTRDGLTGVAKLLGGGVPRWVATAVPGAEAKRWFMIVDKLQPTPARFPRRPGVPKRRPLDGGVASVN